jgi:uncharacterized protein
MIGIIVQLAISWLIIWLFEKNDLRVLGLYPTKRRLMDFALYFLIAGTCCASGFILKMLLLDHQWTINPKLTFGLIGEGIWWNIKSVMFEELIFRGVVLYILIKKMGAVKGILISGIAFGIYHWFSFNAFGNPVQMIFIFLITGIMGLVYAYGYAKTFSLYIPAAIHLGWNLTQGVVFSESILGHQLLVPLKNPDANSYVVFFTILLFPLLSVWIINFLLLKKRIQSV